MNKELTPEERDNQEDENFKKFSLMDFPGGPVVKNMPVNAGDMSSVLGLERFHMLWSN